MKNLIYLLF